MAVTQSIKAQKGRTWLLKISTDGVTFITVGGLRATTLAINNNPVDISSKSSGGVREMIPDAGIQAMSITGSGVVDDTTGGGFEALEAESVNRVGLLYEAISASGAKYVGYFAVSQFSHDGTHTDAETYSVTLESMAAIAYTPPT
jgi:TP901-1 family phage major tail protein